MNLTASLIVKNELGRYLRPCIAHLLEFCDTIRVLDDCSGDGTFDWLADADERVQVERAQADGMFRHEGRSRNELLAWTMKAKPTHILALDADEFVSDGASVRAACATDGAVFTLGMEEVWKADSGSLWTRHDGAWGTHQIPILYRAPRRLTQEWGIPDQQLACGREPLAVRALRRHAAPSGSAILHLGWACEADRQARYDRYVAADNGRFHNIRHLRSIMLPDRRVRLARREWPAALEPYRDVLLARINPAEAA
jgi:glycosyltransferase involved in cell wall biosynthesis